MKCQVTKVVQPFHQPYLLQKEIMHLQYLMPSVLVIIHSQNQSLLALCTKINTKKRFQKDKVTVHVFQTALNFLTLLMVVVLPTSLRLNPRKKTPFNYQVLLLRKSKLLKYCTQVPYSLSFSIQRKNQHLYLIKCLKK